MIKIHNFKFTKTLLDKINKTLTAEPKISRRQLSYRICEWMDWRSPNGKLRDMSCRKALAELHRRGEIKLPECERDFSFQKRLAPRPEDFPVLHNIECSRDELGAVNVIPIKSSQSKNSRIWNALMVKYHYLGRGPLCGAQMRYLVWCERFGWLGGLSFSAAAFRLRSRDQLIGWSENARKHNQQLVVNNSRLLILPTAKVPNLASHVLSQCCKRLTDDWQERYSYRPVLLETYVERGRFSGTCYRAANWSHIGSTSGRGRQGNGTTVKDVFTYPLCQEWRQVLCTEPDGSLSPKVEEPEREPADWTEEEFGGADFGDERLNARLLQLGNSFYANPTANIPQACGTKAACKGAYRFFDNERINMGTILAPHYEATEQRLQSYDIVLAAQNTSSLNYTSHPMTEGLGPINTEKDKSIGLLLHDTMAFTTEGVPLGLLDVQIWARDKNDMGKCHERHNKPIEQKESYKWVKSYRAVSAVQNRCRKTQIISVGDREADIHELFAEELNTPWGADLLVRAERSRNRCIEEEQEEFRFLWPRLQSEEIAGTLQLFVPSGQNRKSRTAKMEIRFAHVVLKAPKRKPGLPAVPIHVVYAKEVDAPQGVDALEWMLLTTVDVPSFDQAVTVLKWYARRWGIEVYHRILKSGCRIEDRQLGQVSRLENCLAVDMVVAWRIHHLTYLGRETPDFPCTVYFQDEEWKALVSFVNQTATPPSEKPPSLREAIHMVAGLGGFLNRKSDQEPGAQTLWRGLQRLDDITQAYIAFVIQPQKTPPHTVSSVPPYG